MSDQREVKLQRYQSHKQVNAGEIVAIDKNANTLDVKELDGSIANGMNVPDDFFARATPSIGDYVVRYDDGYWSHSPKKAFEEGYSIV